MKILFLGSFFPENQKEQIFTNSKGVIQNAGDTYQKALLKGLIELKVCSHIITVPLIGSFPNRYKKLNYKGTDFLHENIIESYSISFNNLTLYKNFSRYGSLKKRVLKLLDKQLEIDTIIVFSLDYSILRTISEIKKVYKTIHVCLIITDLFEYMVFPKSLVTRYIRDYFTKGINDYYKYVDSFVLLTEYMKDKIPLGRKPYTLIEGIYNYGSLFSSDNIVKERNPTILYSGTLASIYGIGHLLRAFRGIENSNYRLWICGEGDAKSEVLQLAREDERVTYFGQLSREEVLTLQKRASVLVNPRFSTDEFTKYSFASKTMEYMASETPVVMHPLKCLDENYRNLICISADETDNGLRNTIMEVCQLTNKERDEIGSRAAAFIRNEKNSTVQAKKIINMINYAK